MEVNDTFEKRLVDVENVSEDVYEEQHDGNDHHEEIGVGIGGKKSSEEDEIAVLQMEKYVEFEEVDFSSIPNIQELIKSDSLARSSSEIMLEDVDCVNCGEKNYIVVTEAF